MDTIPTPRRAGATLRAAFAKAEKITDPPPVEPPRPDPEDVKPGWPRMAAAFAESARRARLNEEISE